MIFFPVDIFS